MQQKPYHHGNLRNTLIEAGIALLNEQGQQHFSLRKVAAKCGVSHAAPYSHFENKEALMEAMKEHVTKQFTEVLEKTVQQHKNDIDIMFYLGNAYISFFVEHKQYFTCLYGKSGIQFDFTENGILENSYTPCSIFKKAAFDIMEKIEYPPQKRLDTLIAMIALVHGITAMLTTQQIVYQGDCKDLLKNSIFANALFADAVTIQKQKREEQL